jgi:ATP-dependent Zn protease
MESTKDIVVMKVAKEIAESFNADIVKVKELISRQHEKARQIIHENEEKLHELADYLCEHETITGEEFMAILNGAPPSEPSDRRCRKALAPGESN